MNDLVIVKLAAIGDVAAACQALLILNESFDLSSLGLHWIIDQNFIPLAQALLSPHHIEVHFHGIDSEKIFKGSPTQKILATLKLMMLTRRLNANAIVILHRDSRYGKALRVVTRAPQFKLQPQQISEGSLYLETLKKAVLTLGLAPHQKKQQFVKSASRLTQSETIGILVGGAKNQKVFYEEKRWPHFASLVTLILQQSAASIKLFGSPEDLPAALSILAHVQSLNLPLHRIENLTGKLALAELPQVLKTLKTFISIDSGLAHIAATVMSAPQQKIITLFGPTDYHLWRPMARGDGQVIPLTRQVSCSPCYKNDGNFKPCLFSGNQFRHCLNDLNPETVFDAVMKS